jgi:glycine cleavage system aminomethyltransferase T
VLVHPNDIVKLWNMLLDAGKPLGILPAGLGARDSARVEAGLPLFGHELEGELGVSLTEAGYGFVVRMNKPFFIGRQAYFERGNRSRRHIIRLRGQGRKTLRGGHIILDPSGAMAGQVTSFAYVHADLSFIVLACVDENFNPEPGQLITGARLSAAEFCGQSGQADERSRVELTALQRFPDDAERVSWATRYGLEVKA